MGLVRVLVEWLKGLKVVVLFEGLGLLLIVNIMVDCVELGILGLGILIVVGIIGMLIVVVCGGGIFDVSKLFVVDGKLISESVGDVMFLVKCVINVMMIGIGMVMVLGKFVCIVKNIGSGIVICGLDKF